MRKKGLSFNRGSQSYKRNIHYNTSGKTFLIVTEGEKTEVNYFTELRKRLKLSSVDIKIVSGKGNDITKLIQIAEDMITQRDKDSKRNIQIVQYDEVWVVYDREGEHSPQRKKTKIAESDSHKNIHLAYSDPCFEYWLLSHKKYTTAPFPDCKSVTNELKKVWDGYKKNLIVTHEDLDNIPEAILNADKCRIFHQKSGGSGNPSTDVDILVKNLNKASREGNRFQL
jgi:RloB-like protein